MNLQFFFLWQYLYFYFDHKKYNILHYERLIEHAKIMKFSLE